MTENIGIYGGTFDPPHLGHLILAAEALSQLQLDRLLWMLTPQPPHKPGRPISPLQQRLDMLQLAIADTPRFELSRVEIDRPGPHYTVETLKILQDAYPSADFTLLMGGDSLRDLPTWRDPSALIAACRYLGVMRRPGDSVDLSALEQQFNGITAKVRFVDAPLLEISSSEIRRRVERGASYRYYLHPGVYDYIERNHLYR